MGHGLKHIAARVFRARGRADAASRSSARARRRRRVRHGHSRDARDVTPACLKDRRRPGRGGQQRSPTGDPRRGTRERERCGAMRASTCEQEIARRYGVGRGGGRESHGCRPGQRGARSARRADRRVPAAPPADELAGLAFDLRGALWLQRVSPTCSDAVAQAVPSTTSRSRPRTRPCNGSSSAPADATSSPGWQATRSATTELASDKVGCFDPGG